MKFNRRQTLLGLSASTLLPAGCATTGGFGQTFATERYQHGVASGDPRSDSIVLWTRVSGLTDAIDVRWQLAGDPMMQRVIASGSVSATPENDYTAKAIATHLTPGATYYYQFTAGSDRSPVGRTKTLPVGPVDEVVLAIVSCSNYPFGYFNGYEAIADDPDVDLVVHLGDYIYEYDIDGYGGTEGKRLGRMHEPAHEIVTLADYRQRHAQYKSEPGALAMHATHPFIHTWDDHESTNNSWTDGAENHQADEGEWRQRKSNSLRAYYEWMPIRRPGAGRTPEQSWSHYRFGDLASLITLESRLTARSKQISFADHRDALADPEAAARFYSDVVGAEDRRLLSAELEAYLGSALSESVSAGRPWRILANQTILADVRMPDIDEPTFRDRSSALPDSLQPWLKDLTALGKLGLPGNMDAWDGYPAARNRLYKIATDSGATDLLVVTGDTHTFWQNQLFDKDGTRMGVELGTSAITSPRGFWQLGDAAMERFDQLNAARNDSVVWSDGSRRGFIRLSLTPEAARADFKALSDIGSRNYRVSDHRSVRIRRRDNTLVYA